MTAVRDHERLRTYQAEDDAFDHTAMTDELSMDECRSIVARVSEHPWWLAHRRRRGQAAGTIRVVAGRSERLSWWRDQDQTLSLSRAGRQLAVITHELAHAATGDDDEPAHGPTFRRSHLDVVALCVGRVIADQLQEAYRLAGLAIAPATPLSPLAGTMTVLDERHYAAARRTGFAGLPTHGSSGPIALS